MNSTRSKKVIRVCQGPGCRAWGAETLFSRLKALTEGTPEKPKICSSACMNRCGGGASVEFATPQAFVTWVKIKNSHDSLQALLCTQPATS